MATDPDDPDFLFDDTEEELRAEAVKHRRDQRDVNFSFSEEEDD